MAIITKYLTLHELDTDRFLIINSLTGAIDIITREDKESIESIIEGRPPEDCQNPDLIAGLEKRGYLFRDEHEESETLLKIFKVYKEIIEEFENRISFILCPTMACNLRCIYCFETEDSRCDSRVMTNTQLDAIFLSINDILTDRKPGYSEIHLFGGEPLLPSTYEINNEIFRRAAARNMPVFITTNGTNIPRYIDLFKEFQTIIPIKIQITLDGIKEIHDMRRIRADNSGTFDEICKGIELLLDTGVIISVRVNLDRGNIERLKEFLSFIAKKGWNTKDNFSCDIAPVSDYHTKGSIPDYMPENEIVKRIGELFPDYSCDAGFFRMRHFRVLHHMNQVMKFSHSAEKVYFHFHLSLP